MESYAKATARRNLEREKEKQHKEALEVEMRRKAAESARKEREIGMQASKETAERARQEALAARAKNLARQLAEEAGKQGIGGVHTPDSDGNLGVVPEDQEGGIPATETPPVTP